MIKLTDVEELIIKLSVLLRNGDFDSFKCHDCNDALKEYRNCVGSPDHNKSVFFHPKIGQIYSCPLLYLGNDFIQSFLDRYDYYEKYPSAVPSYEDVNPRFWQAVKVLETFKYRLIQEEPKGGDSTDENLVKMRALFKKKEA